MSQNLEALIDISVQRFEQCTSLTELDQTKAEFLGKQSALTQAFKGLGTLQGDARKQEGDRLNAIKTAIELALSARKQNIENTLIEQKLTQEALDVTLPGRFRGNKASKHPVTQTIERLETLFHSLGFITADGPEIEDDFHNFTALNTPELHPARSMHDTFYLEGGHLLRTHTSPIQVRYMENNAPPMRIIAPGRVYRVDSDATHSPMFHQIEGLWIDNTVNFANLKSLLSDFFRSFFESDDLAVRFRPSFFPFTEPSAEVDIGCVFCAGKGCRICSHSGFLEVAGAGMVHPNVLKHVNIDPETFQGFAFGMGIERLAMLRYGVNDLRLFYENDLRFLQQFSR